MISTGPKSRPRRTRCSDATWLPPVAQVVSLRYRIGCSSSPRVKTSRCVLQRVPGKSMLRDRPCLPATRTLIPDQVRCDSRRCSRRPSSRAPRFRRLQSRSTSTQTPCCRERSIQRSTTTQLRAHGAQTNGGILPSHKQGTVALTMTTTFHRQYPVRWMGPNL